MLMSDPKEPVSPLPVLGMFANEGGLRGYIAQNLGLVERGLELLDIEYSLDNPTGAGGRVDILARDRLDHIVCIEIKRSDQSARATLNELSKYVALLYERHRVPREIIRCIVVSTHWSELLLPLSYFAAGSGVDVVALKAVADGGAVRLDRIDLREMRFLPQLCPAIEIFWFDYADDRDRFVNLLRQRSSTLPFVRLALLLLEPDRTLEPGRSPFAVVGSVWRISDIHLPQIEAVIEKAVGSDFPYAATGWEAELDAMDWINDVLSEIDGPTGFNHATSESLRNLLATYRVVTVDRIGDWPKLDFINSKERILDAILSRSPLGGSERANMHSYEATASPAVAPSWRLAVEGFLTFIAFEPEWREKAEAFLDAIPHQYDVHLHAFDKKHLYYAIHQARAHPDAMLSYFDITVLAQGEFVTSMVGLYRWDGKTCPADARAAIETVYGDTHWAIRSLWSSVDKERYEGALPLHGFLPEVDVFVSEDDLAERCIDLATVRPFVDANPDYAAAISAILED